MLSAGRCRRGGAVLMPPGRCVGLRPGMGRVARRAPALCSGSGFLRGVRRSAIGEAWPPRLRFRPSPRAPFRCSFSAPPTGKELPGHETKDGPDRKKALAGRGPVPLPCRKRAAVAVPCSCLRAAVWACVRAWAVFPDVLRPCVPAPVFSGA